jgi:hypothetical protein
MTWLPREQYFAQKNAGAMEDELRKTITSCYLEYNDVQIDRYLDLLVELGTIKSHSRGRVKFPSGKIVEI